MKNTMEIIHRGAPKNWRQKSLFTVEKAELARSFHRSFPLYTPTPLVSLEDLAAALGVGMIYVKDESKRFGLNAFKGLGGSCGIGRYLGEQLGLSPKTLTYNDFTAKSVRRKLKGLTVVTATDGNHGRGVAWAAAQLGLNAVVYLPKGSAKERLENIRALGAEAYITEMGYDDTVRFAGRQAEKMGWVLIQDTDGENYRRILWDGACPTL